MLLQKTVELYIVENFFQLGLREKLLFWFMSNKKIFKFESEQTEILEEKRHFTFFKKQGLK